MLHRRREESAARIRPLYKLISLLLQYPDERLWHARDELLAAVAEFRPSPSRDAVARFCEFWQRVPRTRLAQIYVETFDVQRRSGLYLSYYLYGDTRKRGMALLRLKRLYRLAGLILEGGELPDYLPVMLEFAACAPAGVGAHVLGEHRAALAFLHRSLREAGSPYAHLVGAVCSSLPALTMTERSLVEQLIANGPPREQVGLEPYGPADAMPVAEARR